MSHCFPFYFHFHFASEPVSSAVVSPMDFRGRHRQRSRWRRPSDAAQQTIHFFRGFRFGISTSLRFFFFYISFFSFFFLGGHPSSRSSFPYFFYFHLFIFLYVCVCVRRCCCRCCSAAVRRRTFLYAAFPRRPLGVSGSRGTSDRIRAWRRLCYLTTRSMIHRHEQQCSSSSSAAATAAAAAEAAEATNKEKKE